jgi:hypothetical protein
MTRMGWTGRAPGDQDNPVAPTHCRMRVGKDRLGSISKRGDLTEVCWRMNK